MPLLKSFDISSLFKYNLIDTLIVAVLILFTAILISRLLKKLIIKHTKVNTKFILRMKSILVYTMAGYACLSLFTPFHAIMTPILASGGVLALIFGLAAQEAIGNFVNGIMITMFKPFKIGDLIKVNNGELIGTVYDISLRHTIIETYENTKIVIPNSAMNKAILENVSSVESHKANFLLIGISYESNLKKAMKIIEEEVMAHPNFLDIRSKEEIANHKKPSVIIRLIDFADSSMQLRATVYSKNNAEGFAMLSDLRISIKQRFDKEGIEIPYPHRTITYKHEKKS